MIYNYMNMKKYFLLVVLFVMSQPLFAQSAYHYDRDTVVCANGERYTISDNAYKFKVVKDGYTLYNQETVDFQGNVILPGAYYGAGVVIDSFWQAFTETFTEEEIAVMRDAEEPTIIRIYITKDHNGKALEVVLSIWKTAGVVVIAPHKWAQYEQNLKKYVQWHEVTEDEKNMPFSHHSYRIGKRDLVRRFAVLPDVEPINPM